MNISLPWFFHSTDRVWQSKVAGSVNCCVECRCLTSSAAPKKVPDIWYFMVLFIENSSKFTFWGNLLVIFSQRFLFLCVFLNLQLFSMPESKQVIPAWSSLPPFSIPFSGQILSSLYFSCSFSLIFAGVQRTLREKEGWLYFLKWRRNLYF